MHACMNVFIRHYSGGHTIPIHIHHIHTYIRAAIFRGTILPQYIYTTYIHTYKYTYTYTHTYVQQGSGGQYCPSSGQHTYIHTHIHTAMFRKIVLPQYTYIHTHIHTYIRAARFWWTVLPEWQTTYIHTYIHTHIHTYVQQGSGGQYCPSGGLREQGLKNLRAIQVCNIYIYVCVCIFIYIVWIYV